MRWLGYVRLQEEKSNAYRPTCLVENNERSHQKDLGIGGGMILTWL
jgi:hypothetical protein